MPSLDAPFELLPVRLQAVRHARRDQGRFGRAGRLRARELDRPRLPRPEGSVAPDPVKRGAERRAVLLALLRQADRTAVRDLHQASLWA